MTFYDDTSESNGAREAGSSSESAAKSSGSSMAKCSLCGARFDRKGAKSFPFCSTRCRQIDLGNWLNEGYGLPVESADLDMPEHE